MLTREQFEVLAPNVDAVSLMTYDFSDPGRQVYIHLSNYIQNIPGKELFSVAACDM